MKKSLWIGWLALLCVQAVCAGEWQWAVTLKGIVSEETHKEPEAFCGFLKNANACRRWYGASRT